MKKTARFSVILATLVQVLFSSALASGPERLKLMFFYGEGCPHCAEEKKFLAEAKEKYPALEVVALEVWHNKENAKIFEDFLKKLNVQTASVPVTAIGDRVWIGFSRSRGEEMERYIEAALAGGERPADEKEAAGAAKEAAETSIDVPLLGRVGAERFSLPVFTVVVAAVDSFNPCAFFVLFFLLSLLIHARSRRRMLLVGGTFVFFSGLMYFLFMAAWLNVFLLMGHVPAITAGAGAVALLVAALNIKDFFMFGRGVSLTIPERAKPRLFARMRDVLGSASIVHMLSATVALAVAANAYELLCTAGFPMVFTRVLTLQGMGAARYYTYLFLYNAVYVVPLAAIVVTFVVTLGARKLTEWQGRKLKLVSGVMMLAMGLVLVADPSLLNHLAVTLGMVAMALLVSGLIILAAGRLWPEIRER